MTVSIELKGEFGAHDFDGMRKRTDELQRAVTSTLRDREIRTEVDFADGRTGIKRWRRDRLRDRTLVGMGDVLLTNAADFDFEVGDLVNEETDGTISCSGSLRNLRTQPVDELDIQCSGNRKHVIRVTHLAPSETRAFSQTFAQTELGEVAFLTVVVDGKPYEARDLDEERRNEALFAVATKAYAATRLALREHDVSRSSITVDLRADTAFLKLDRAAQEAAAATAYEHYAAFREIYRVDSNARLRLVISVEPTDVEFEFDGTKLTGG